MEYVKIEFKGGWALLAKGEFNPKEHKLYFEPTEKLVEEVEENASRRRGRKREE